MAQALRFCSCLVLTLSLLLSVSTAHSLHRLSQIRSSSAERTAHDVDEPMDAQSLPSLPAAAALSEKGEDTPAVGTELITLGESDSLLVRARALEAWGDAHLPTFASNSKKDLQPAIKKVRRRRLTPASQKAARSIFDRLCKLFLACDVGTVFLLLVVGADSAGKMFLGPQGSGPRKMGAQYDKHGHVELLYCLGGLALFRVPGMPHPMSIAPDPEAMCPWVDGVCCSDGERCCPFQHICLPGVGCKTSAVPLLDVPGYHPRLAVVGVDASPTSPLDIDAAPTSPLPPAPPGACAFLCLTSAVPFPSHILVVAGMGRGFDVEGRVFG